MLGTAFELCRQECILVWQERVSKAIAPNLEVRETLQTHGEGRGGLTGGNKKSSGFEKVDKRGLAILANNEFEAQG